MSGIRIPDHVIQKVEEDASRWGISSDKYQDYFDTRVGEIFRMLIVQAGDASQYASEAEYDREIERLAEEYAFESVPDSDGTTTT
jgi:hypothetical protein